MPYGDGTPYRGPAVQWNHDTPLRRATGRGRNDRRETVRANEALAVYAGMGYKRSLIKLQNVFIEQKNLGGDPPTIIFSTLSNWSVNFLWQARITRWDELERDNAVAEMAQERVKERQTRIILLRGLRAKINAAVLTLQPGDAGWSNVIAGVRMLLDQSRREFGDDIQEHAITLQTAGGRFEDLPDAELSQVLENLLAAFSLSGDALDGDPTDDRSE